MKGSHPYYRDNFILVPPPRADLDHVCLALLPAGPESSLLRQNAARPAVMSLRMAAAAHGRYTTPISARYDDTEIRMAAFDRVRKLCEIHDHLTAAELKPGFVFQRARIPLVNPQRGIFKPTQMRYLLSIETVFPKPGPKVWYDDQRNVHRQIYESEESVDYAFMGLDPNVADNRWLRKAHKNQIPIIYFLGIAPGRYQAILPAFVSGWDANSLKGRVAFGASDQEMLSPPENALERRYALRAVKRRLYQASFREAVITAYNGRCALSGLPESRFWTPPTSSLTRTSGWASRWCQTAFLSQKSIMLDSMPT